jgi:predicted Zn-dependent protease
MRKLALACLALMSFSALSAGGILEVLERSHRQRLESLTGADPQTERSLVVRRSFERLRTEAGLGRQVELKVIRGEILAETLNGRLVVANEALADMSEGERSFVLAHELGHVALDHWARLGAVYLKHIPGAVTPERTDPVAAALGREASALSHNHELDADAFSVRLLRRHGYSENDAYTAFQRMGLTRDTPTHPGTRKRMASLRELLNAPVRTAELTTSE